jgi:hypothetical protein
MIVNWVAPKWIMSLDWTSFLWMVVSFLVFIGVEQVGTSNVIKHASIKQCTAEIGTEFEKIAMVHHNSTRLSF